MGMSFGFLLVIFQPSQLQRLEFTKWFCLFPFFSARRYLPQIMSCDQQNDFKILGLHLW